MGVYASIPIFKSYLLPGIVFDLLLLGFIWKIQDIEVVESYRYLDIVLDHELSFRPHVEQLAKTLRPWVAILFRMRRRLP